MSDRHEGAEVGIDSGAGFGSGADNGRRLDGNAAAGPLSELFTVDLVAAISTCAHCGRDAALGEHLVYADAPALVVRCPTCTGVVLRYASAGGRIRIDLSGARLVVLDASDAP
jgi:hypothetical protein